MKIKPEFITNSSSANFVIKKKHLTTEEIVFIKNHLEIAILMDEQNGNKNLTKYASSWDAWHIEETDYEIKGYTSMTNFSMLKFLTEALNIPKEIIKYEKQSHDDWWDKIILLGGDTFPGWGVIEGEVTNQCIANLLPDLSHVKLWTSQGTYNPKNINKEVNKGARFVEYSGHGFEFGMGTYPPNDQNRITYRTCYLLGLHNFYKLPVVFFDACLTAKLNYELGDQLGLYGFLNIPMPVYGWYWVKKIGGGAIATIGATEVAYSFVGANGPEAGAGYLSLQFFEGYNVSKTLGEMLVYSQNNYLNELWKDHWTIEQFILLGDPTLMVGGGIE